MPTPGVLGCDLHVHAPELRRAGDAGGPRPLARGRGHRLRRAHRAQHRGRLRLRHRGDDLRGELLSVTGVEFTTYNKGFKLLAFSYPVSQTVPPYKHTSMNAIFRAVRAGDPNRYFQLNHPRLPKGIGYFANIGFDPKLGRGRIHNRVDFDGIEVFNGYDSERPDRIETVLRDYWALLNFGWKYTATGSSDSHRIQFHWAGSAHDGLGRPAPRRRRAAGRPAGGRGQHQEGARHRHQWADHRGLSSRALPPAMR